ncbi:MAG: hypothetical protein RR206_08600, partial [Bacteroidaceae bacterium]
ARACPKQSSSSSYFSLFRCMTIFWCAVRRGSVSSEEQPARNMTAPRPFFRVVIKIGISVAATAKPVLKQLQNPKENTKENEEEQDNERHFLKDY